MRGSPVLGVELSPTERITRVARWARIFLFALIAECLLLVSICWISQSFAYDSNHQDRPILAVVSLCSAAFVAQMVALWAALRMPNAGRMAGFCFVVACLFRLMFLTTEPIQEVDLYRYIWDGAVVCEGVSPYRHSPESVTSLPNAEGTLRQLQDMAGERVGLSTVLARVHYPQVTTVYPPVSQFVFAAASLVTPEQASARRHVLTMKIVIVAFDVGTLALLLVLLRIHNVHPGWSIVYGWSPLVLKEFANSGHLDSIAVFFVVAAIVCLSKTLQQATDTRTPKRWIVASAICLGLAVGAKLFPIVLFPICFAFAASRLNVRAALGWGAIALATAFVSVAPMLKETFGKDDAIEQEGLTTFLSHWEMNDLIFMVIEENIRPEGVSETQPRIWFTIVPADARSRVTGTAQRLFGIDPANAPFLVTRVITTIAFVGIALFLAYRIYRGTDLPLESFPNAVFLTIAWFWFLAPTQNPWYWIWALPFITYSRNRFWLLVAAMTMVYYCRFWYEYHAPSFRFFDETYVGAQIFDYIIVWLEFVPVLVLVGASSLGVFRAAKRQAVRPSSM